jgi:hypothetical protein
MAKKTDDTVLYVVLFGAAIFAYTLMSGSSSAASGGAWQVGPTGATTRTNSDGSVDTLIAGGKLYIEVETNGNKTIYTIQGAALNNATLNADGSVDIPTTGGGYTEYDTDGSVTQYNAAGVAISS